MQQLTYPHYEKLLLDCTAALEHKHPRDIKIISYDIDFDSQVSLVYQIIKTKQTKSLVLTIEDLLSFVYLKMLRTDKEKLS